MESQLVEINGVSITRVSYKDEPVITFGMIDQVHERPEGTAHRNFNQNRERFIEGEDFFLIKQPSNEFRGLGINISPRGSYLLTKMGYLMLTKSLTDDLAWEVQRQLVNNYFAVTVKAPAPTPAPADRLPTEAELAQLSFFGEVSAAKLPKKAYHLGVVYALELDNGYVKIGQTTRPEGRIGDLVKNYRAFAGVRRVAVSKECLNFEDIERQLHAKFVKRRVDGELFQIGMIEVLKALTDIELQLPDGLSAAISDQADHNALLRKYERLERISEIVFNIYWRMGYSRDAIDDAVEHVLRTEAGLDVLPRFPASMCYSAKKWGYIDEN